MTQTITDLDDKFNSATRETNMEKIDDLIMKAVPDRNAQNHAHLRARLADLISGYTDVIDGFNDAVFNCNDSNAMAVSTAVSNLQFYAEELLEAVEAAVPANVKELLDDMARDGR